MRSAATEESAPHPGLVLLRHLGKHRVVHLTTANSKESNAMASGVDLWMYLNTSCVECTADLVPPPDSILGIPPPPLPAFLQRAPSINTSTCSVLCDWNAGPGGCEAVLYPCPSSGGALTPDSRVLWAALTPRGTTQHFTTEPPAAVLHLHHQHHPPLYGATLQHRSLPPIPTTSPQHPTPPPPMPPPTHQGMPPPHLPVSFDNSGFVDSDDPTPVVESYQLSDLIESTPSVGSNSLGRRTTPRPRVSSPTRIEHPNLPPLNLHPSHRSLRRATLSRRESDAAASSGSSSPIVL
ncbi:hypothetical protein C0J52_11462 [Blattella germanica]|nr:hypothetical protein C0J52_11462 [Blattella germanica]